MRQVNPLIVALFLVVFLAVVVVRLEYAKESLHDARAELQETKVLAERIVALKQSWGDSPQKANSLRQLLASSLLKNAGIEKKKGRDTMVISAKSLEMKAASHLLNKLLNGTYVIKKMDVRQVDSAHLAVHVEVAE